ncbi:hypothetical protein BN946_scf184747.g13 [Trametes cinnabarina]|uniref:Uncharacterized protein n=1 Tax=Pycnoporus cinnabarinus TaxID=5643 RepID=A0A060SS42_PYCCI|nr:hypothetical protein BN946_scf184747.g13 [Trametes cinnabarina]
MTSTYTLLQFSADPWNARFEDLESRLAFSVYVPAHILSLRRATAAAHQPRPISSTMVDENPNLIMKIAREAPWAQQHPDIMGPNNSYLYFGPNRTPGHLIYGNSTYQTMAQARNRKKETST